MTDTSGFGGFSLLDLFKLEAESNCAALSDGLLALEKTPNDRSVVEPLMRAAHSIKGAARIIGLDVIVSLAHAMEDCFLAAKDGRESLGSARVDQLLQGVDVLGEVRSITEPELPAWKDARADRIASLVAQLKAPPPAQTAPAPVVQVAPAPTPPPVEVPEAPVQAPAQAGAPAPSATGPASTVRVGASVLNRMMFLAGESTVEASRFQAMRLLLAGLKSRERALDTALQSLRESLRGGARTGGGASSRAEQATEASLEALTAAADGVQGAIVDQSARFEEAFRRMEELSGALYAEVLRSRMRPFSEGITGFPRMVRDISRQLGKSVELRIEGESVTVDRDILQKLESPLTHMIRNSLDHGVESPPERQAAGKAPGATITLTARHQSGMLIIEVRDDGRGIDPEAVRRKVLERRMVDEATAGRLTTSELMEFLFLPGFSTKQAVSEISGRGVGLDVVQTMVQQVSGSVTLESEFGRGARFTIRLPVTRSVIRAALVRIGGELFAMPLARLDRIALVARDSIETVQGRMQFTLEDRSIGLVHAAQVLSDGQEDSDADVVPVLVIGSDDDRCGLVVESICGEEDLVVRPLDARLGTVPHIGAAAIRSDGEPVLVVDIDDLLRSVKQSLQGGRMLGVATPHAVSARHDRRRILVVDDSITVREVERQLLLRRGYEVDVAVDGKEGYNALRAGRYDLMVTDVDMPRMTGIELIRAVRREPKFADLPIIIVSYKDREEDRLMGLEAGASAYLTKSSFQDESLIRMVEDLIGAPA
jgi:two-component system sensor histidine kinase and response regulator WspE